MTLKINACQDSYILPNESDLGFLNARLIDEVEAVRVKEEGNSKSLSWLSSGHPLKNMDFGVNWNLLSVLAADSSIMDTPFELRGDALEVAQYLKKFVQAQHSCNHLALSSQEELQIENFLEILDEILEILELFNSIRVKLSVDNLSSEKRADIIKVEAANLLEKFNKTQQGWLPLGWVNSSSSSHFMLGRIQGNTLTYVAMGSGLSLHRQVIDFRVNPVRDSRLVNPVDQDYRFQCFSTLADCRPEKLYSMKFFQTVLVLNLMHTWDKDFRAGVNNIYGSLPCFLKGHFVEPLCEKQYPELYVKNSRAGTCVGKVMLRAFHLHLTGIFSGGSQFKVTMGTKLFKLQKLLMHSHLLVEICRAHLVDGKFQNLTSYNVNLLEEIVGNLRDAKKKTILRDDCEGSFIEELTATLDDIEEKLEAWKAAKKNEEAQISANAVLLPIREEGGLNSLMTFPKHSEEIQAIIPKVKSPFIGPEMEKVQKNISALLKKPIRKFTVLNTFFKVISNLFFTLNNPTSPISQNLAELTYEERQAWFSLTREMFLEVIVNLPEVVNLSEPEKVSFWREIEGQHQKTVFENIFYLLRTIILFDTKIYQLTENNQHDAKGIIAIYQCLSILDFLARRDPSNKLEGEPKIAVQALFSEVRQGNFLIVNANWHNKLKEIAYYFADDEYKKGTLESGKWNYLFTDWLLDIEKRELFSDPVQNCLKSLFIFGIPASENGFPILDEDLLEPSGILLWKGYLDEDRLHKDPTLVYYKKFLSHDNKDQSLLQKVALILTDDPDNPKYLPKQIHILKLACWFAQLYASSGPERQELCKITHEPIQVKLGQISSVPLTYSLIASIKGIELGSSYVSYTEKKQLLDVLRTGFEEQTQEHKLSRWVDEHLDSHRVIHTVMGVQDPETVKSMLLCGCDAYDSVNSLLFLGKNRIDLLSDSFFRSWMKREIFRAGRFPAQMQDIPLYGKEIAGFFKHVLKEFEVLKNWNAWFDVAYWMKELLMYYPKARWGAVTFPKVREICISILQKEKLTPEMQLKAAQTLLLLNRPQYAKKGFKSKKIHSIAEDLYIFKVVQAMRSDVKTDKDFEVAAFLVYLQGLCERYVSETKDLPLNPLLNTLLSIYKNEVVEDVWSGEYPLFSNGQQQIHLETGEIYQDGELYSDLPEWVKREKSFFAVTQGKYSSIHKSSSGSFIIYPQKVTLNIHRKDIVYNKEEDGLQYRTVPLPYEIQEVLPGYFNEDTLCWLCEGENPHLKIQLSHSNILRVNLKRWEKPSDSGSETLKKLDEEVNVSWKNFKENNHKEDLQKWQKLMRQSSAHRVAQNDSSDKTYYQIKDICHSEEKIWVSSNEFEELNLLFKVFEPERKNILCWRTQDAKHVSEVSIASIGLEFFSRKTVSDKYLYMKGVSGYYLTDLCNIPQLPQGMHCILLQHHHKYKIVLPRVRLLTTLSLDNGLLTVKVKQQLSSINAWIHLSLVDGLLGGQSIEEKLYLLYIQVASRSYPEAINSLKQIMPLRSFSSAEWTLLEWIKENLLSAGVSKCHPQALVIVICLMLLQKKIQEQAVSSVELVRIYKAYLRVQSNLVDEKLHLHEENAFLTIMKERLKNERMGKKEDLKRSSSSRRISQDPFEFICEQLGWGYSISLREHEYFNDFKRRWEYLHGYVVEAGTHSPTKLPKLTSLFSLHKGKEISVTELSNVIIHVYQYSVKGDILSYCIASHDDVFKNNFLFFYRTLLSGEEREKKNLEEILELNLHLKSHPEGSPYRDLLHALLKTKAYLPSPESIGELLRNYEKDPEKHRAALNALAEKILSAGKFKVEVWKEVKSLTETLFTLGITWIKTQLESFEPHQKGSRRKVDVEKGLTWKVGHLNDIENHFRNLYSDLLKTYFVSYPAGKEAYPPPFEVEKVTDPAIKARLETLNKDLLSYRSMLEQAVDYKISTLGGEACKNRLVKIHEHLTSVIKVQASVILWKANQTRPLKNSEGSLIERNFGMGRRKKVTWDDLRVLFDRNSASLFEERTYLDHTQICSLMEEYAAFLLNIRHLLRLDKCIDLISKNLEPGIDPKVCQARESQVAEILSSKCLYEHSIENRDLLLAEAAQGSFLRGIFGEETQYSLMNKVLDNPSRDIVVKAPTGSGKSDLLSFLLARRKLISGPVIYTVPETHEKVNSLQIQKKWGEFFGREVDRFEFNGGKIIAPYALDLEDEELAHHLGTHLHISTHYSMQMMEVHFIWNLLNAGNRPSAQSKEILTNFIKKLRYISLATNIIDEPDRHTPLDMVIIAYGKPDKISAEHVTLIDMVVEALLDPEIKDLVKLQANKQPMLLKEDYLDKVVPHVVKKVQGKLKIDSSIEDSFRDFVQGKSSKPEWLATHPLKESIYLLNELITGELDAALKGYVDKDYGLYKQHFKTKKFAGPYVTTNIAKENSRGVSQYLIPDTTFLRSLITYLVKGLDKEQTISNFKMIKNQIAGEVAGGKSIEKVKKFKKIKAVINDNNINVMDLSEQDMRDLHPKVCLDPFFVSEYVKHEIAEQIEFFEYMIVSTQANYSSMFANTIGMTATPPPIMQQGLEASLVKVEGVDGIATHLSLQWGSEPDGLQIVEDGSPQELLRQTSKLVGENSDIRQVVDPGGAFKGLNNEFVVDDFAKNGCLKHEILVFFNQEEQVFRLKDLKSKYVLNVGKDILDPEKYLVYLDAARSQATNIELILKAISLIWLDFTMTDLHQPMGRVYRDKPYERKAKLLLQFSQAKIIFGDVELKNIYDLLIYLLKNQENMQSYLNYLSQKQLLDNCLRNPLLKLILGAKADRLAKGILEYEEKVDIQKAIELAQAYKEVLITKVKTKAEDRYEKPTGEIKALTDLQVDSQRCESLLNTLKQVPKEIYDAILVQINSIKSSWDRPEIKIQLNTAIKHSEASVAEIEAHQKFQLESQFVKEEIASDRHDLRGATVWDPNFDYHTRGWERPLKVRGIVVSIERYISKKFEKWFSSVQIFEKWLKIKEKKNIYYKILFKPLQILPVAAYAITLVGLMFIQAFSYAWGRKSIIATRIFLQREILENQLPEEFKTLVQTRKYSNLLVTNNFMRQYPEAWGERKQKLRSEEDMPLHTALVIRDETTLYGDKIQTILLTPEESQFFHSYLLRHQVSNNEFKKRTLCLYDIRNNRITCMGKFRITNEILHANQYFKDQILDAKLDYGCTHFTTEEKECLKERGASLKTDEGQKESIDSICTLKEYLVNFVHKNHPEKQAKISELL